MHKSSFFAFLAVFLLILLGLKGFHLLQYRPWHADGHFRYPVSYTHLTLPTNSIV